MATRNSDGTVTLRTRGSLAYTPTAQSGIASSASRGPGFRVKGGRLTLPKGTGYSGKSAYK